VTGALLVGRRVACGVRGGVGVTVTVAGGTAVTVVVARVTGAAADGNVGTGWALVGAVAVAEELLRWMRNQAPAAPARTTTATAAAISAQGAPRR
jgi:hypothetical protein